MVVQILQQIRPLLQITWTLYTICCYVINFRRAFFSFGYNDYRMAIFLSNSKGLERKFLFDYCRENEDEICVNESAVL